MAVNGGSRAEKNKNPERKKDRQTDRKKERKKERGWKRTGIVTRMMAAIVILEQVLQDDGDVAAEVVLVHRVGRGGGRGARGEGPGARPRTPQLPVVVARQKQRLYPAIPRRSPVMLLPLPALLPFTLIPHPT